MMVISEEIDDLDDISVCLTSEGGGCFRDTIFLFLLKKNVKPVAKTWVHDVKDVSSKYSRAIIISKSHPISWNRLHGTKAPISCFLVRKATGHPFF